LPTLHKTFANHLVDRRFDKGGTDDVALTLSFPKVGNE